jgi:hypothetical protein
MEPIERALKAIRGTKGVVEVRLLTQEEKKLVLDAEAQAEEKVVLGMGKSVNEGVREALNRGFTVALVIQSSEFVYPHEPHMMVLCEDQVIGEGVYDKTRLEKLKASKNCFFLWDNFVLYRDRLPRDPARRDKIRVLYRARNYRGLEEPLFQGCVLGIPSMEGDAAVKKILAFEDNDPVYGTCLVGFNRKK